MTNALGGVRSQASRRACGGAGRPSIREVCLVGIEPARSAAASPARPTPLPEGAWASGRRVTWSGRTYRVEATQVRMTGADAPLRYVHLSCLAEG